MLMFRPLVRYADFSGRARRSEYWLFQLLQIVIYIGLIAMIIVGAGERLTDVGQMMARGLGAFALIGIVALASFLPNLAVTVRRLHDTDKSAWWLLLYAPGMISAVMAVQALSTSGTHVAAGALGPAALFSLVGKGCNLVMFIMMCIRGNSGSNRYGPDPKGGADIDVAKYFDAPEADAEPEPVQREAHKPVFDFGPARGVPAVRETAPAPTPRPAPAATASVARPTFGKRR